MDIHRKVIEKDGVKIPCIMIAPANPLGAAVIVHGYGGCKEEQLGLAWRVAEQGLITYTIDLRGHGQHPLPLDEKIVVDIEASIDECRPYGKVVAIGHSLGGRLALLSSADYAIGISPALNTVYGTQTREILKNFRKYKVRDGDAEDFLEVFNHLPLWEFRRSKPSLIIYGSRDVPEIISTCHQISDPDIAMVMIDQALHNDIFLSEATYDNITRQLQKWYV